MVDKHDLKERRAARERELSDEKPPPTLRRRLLTVAGVLVVLLLVWQLRVFTWPETEGWSVETARYTIPSFDEQKKKKRRGVFVTYRYRVENVVYEATQHTFAQDRYHARRIEESNRYGHFQVHYSRRNPALSTLTPFKFPVRGRRVLIEEDEEG